jgi:hypothetical protein
MQKEQVLHKHFLIFVSSRKTGTSNVKNSLFRYTNDDAAPGYQVKQGMR